MNVGNFDVAIGPDDLMVASGSINKLFYFTTPDRSSVNPDPPQSVKSSYSVHRVSNSQPRSGRKLYILTSS